MFHAVLLGPIKGHVVLQSGKHVEVNADRIEVSTLEEAQEIAHLVGERYAAEGHPLHAPDEPFVHHVTHEKFKTYQPHVGNKTLHQKKA